MKSIYFRSKLTLRLRHRIWHRLVWIWHRNAWLRWISTIWCLFFQILIKFRLNETLKINIQIKNNNKLPWLWMWHRISLYNCILSWISGWLCNWDGCCCNYHRCCEIEIKHYFTLAIFSINLKILQQHFYFIFFSEFIQHENIYILKTRSKHSIQKCAATHSAM